MIADISGLCRGGAKIFFRLSIKDAKPGEAVFFRAQADGRAVPFMAFEGEDLSPATEASTARDFVIVLPQVRVPVDFSVLQRPSAPEPEIVKAFKIAPGSAKWHSRLNGLLHSDVLAAIRNCDLDRTLGRAVIEFSDCVTVRDTRNGEPKAEECIYHGIVSVPCALSAPDFSMRCVTSSLEDAGVSFTCLPVKRVDSSEDKTAPLWEMAFAMRAPLGLDGFICHVEDPEGAPIVGFESLMHDQIEGLKAKVSHFFEHAQYDPEYHEWLLAKRPTLSALAMQRTQSLPNAPRFSVVVMLGQCPVELAEKTIDSILRQSYEGFELIIAYEDERDPKLAQMAIRYADADSRVVLLEPAKRGAGSSRFAEAVAAATKEYVAFIAPGDLLEPNALFEYASAINDDGSIDALYSDEDIVLDNGRFAQPFLKPDFSIDYLRSTNYICRLLAVRKAIADSILAADVGIQDFRDFGFTLRLTEAAESIAHIDKVLYHRHEPKKNPHKDADTAPDRPEAGIAALQGHLSRLGISADVLRYRLDSYRVDYRVQGDPLVSIVIPSKDHTETLDICLRSILEKTTYANYEIVIVENNSTESDTFEYYRRIQESDSRIRVVEWPGTGFNYSSIINYGAEQARGEYLLMLNNDTEVITPDWVGAMVGCCQREEVGIVGARLRFPDDTIQHAGVVVTDGSIDHWGYRIPVEDGGYMHMLDRPRNVSAVTGACMLVEKALFASVGGFDETLAVVFNDIDFCLRVRQLGKLVVYTPFVELYHHESFSRGKEDTDSKRLRFIREMTYFWYRWPDYHANGDPYFNRNFIQHGLLVIYHHLAR